MPRKKKLKEPKLEPEQNWTATIEPEAEPEIVVECPQGYHFNEKLDQCVADEPTVEDELKALKKTVRAIAEEFPLWPGATDTTFLEKEFGPAYTESLGKLKVACK